VSCLFQARDDCVRGSFCYQYFFVGAVLTDLGVLELLNPCIITEEVGIEKSDLRIWTKFIQHATGFKFSDVLHVGDELDMYEPMILYLWAGIMIQDVANPISRDYQGALRAGLRAVLLRRKGDLGSAEWKEDGEELAGVMVVKGLDEVVELVRRSSTGK